MTIGLSDELVGVPATDRSSRAGRRPTLLEGVNDRTDACVIHSVDVGNLCPQLRTCISRKPLGQLPKQDLPPGKQQPAQVVPDLARPPLPRGQTTMLSEPPSWQLVQKHQQPPPPPRETPDRTSGQPQHRP
mmetsp:Transcript_11855/g.35487  ORF Transcript_11855/g.35487 Transcript_11855/m.35487 type:complete len:131 (-) Transcript_11855:1375-1767(-)